MSRDLYNVVIDKVITPVKAQIVDSTNAYIASVDSAGNVAVKAAAGTALIGKVGIDQTTPGTTNNVYVTTVKPDGTNIMPSQDTVARRAYQQITDGTNTMPTGDVAARRIYTQPTDGTNLQPMGDAAARRILAGITDATNAVSVMKDDGATYVLTGFNVGGVYLGSYNKSLQMDVKSADARAVSGSSAFAQTVLAYAVKFNGATMDRVRVANLFLGGQGVTTVTLAAAGASKKNRLHSILISATAAGYVTVGDFTSFIVQMAVANEAYHFRFTDGILQSTANTAIGFTHSVAGTTVTVFLQYNIE